MNKNTNSKITEAIEDATFSATDEMLHETIHDSIWLETNNLTFVITDNAIYNFLYE